MTQPPQRFRDRLRLSDGALRSALELGLFPASLLLFVGGGAILFEHFDPNGVALGVYFGTIPLFFLLERMLPWSEAWLGSQGDVHADIGLVVLAGFVAPLLDGALGATAVVLGAWLAANFGSALWPSHWPVIAQGALAIVVGDFFRYWVHRALHESPVLWRIHATHHSSTRLYFWNGARIHPIEIFLTGFVEMLPLIALGASGPALAMRMLIGRVIGRFQHCNLDLRLGFFDYVFSTPINHRWHHSRDLEEAAHNYGGDLVLWDHVFGSFYLPKDRAPSDRVGIGNMPEFPTSLPGLLLSPFRWRRHLAREGRTAR